MPPEGIRIDSFMLADAASTFGGKLYVHGGGWNVLTVYEPTQPRPVTVVGRVIIPKTDKPQKHLLEIHFRARSDGEIAESQPLMRMVFDPFTSSEGYVNVESSTPFVIEVPGIVFGAPGEYEFVAVTEGIELATSLLHVVFADNPPILGSSTDREAGDTDEWTDAQRAEWARGILRQNGIEPARGDDEQELDYRQRLIEEIAKIGYEHWELTPEGSHFLFTVDKKTRQGPSQLPAGSTSVTGAGKTVEEAVLMALAIALDMVAGEN